MHIVKTLPEFAQLISVPNTACGYVPDKYKVLDLNPINTVFQNQINCLVYADVKEYMGRHLFVRYNPSFDVNIMARKFAINSPIFVKATIPLTFKSADINEIILELMQQIPGTHIAEPIFSWNQPPDHLSEISTQ